MKSSRLATLLFLFCGLLLCARAGETAWPGVEYETVRAYLYRGHPDAKHEIVLDGNINPSVEKVVRLSPEQGSKIASAMREVPKDSGSFFACYAPHHSLVFFDREGNPIVWLEICLTCHKVQGNAPMPAGKMWDFDALRKLFQEWKIPVPDEPAFQEFLKPGEEMREKISRLESQLEGKLKAGGFDAETAIPPADAAWPWRPFAKVKLYAYNEANVDEWIVALGKINPSVTKEVQLSPAQQTEVWTAFRRRETVKLNAQEKVMQARSGEYYLDNESLSIFAPWKPGPKRVRHALVCFDDKDRPVAWLQLSFSDFTYRASPTDGLLRDIRWSPRRLAELFPKMGIPVDVPNAK